MKPSRVALFSLAIICVVGFLLWLYHEPGVVTRRISLTILTNSPATNQIRFRLRNDEALAIFVSELTIETRKSGGWLTFDKLVPKDSRVVEAGKLMDFEIPIPRVTDPWRLRATYGEAMHGPGLLFLTATFAIQHRRIPGAGFGGFSGHDSALSAEVEN